VDAPSLSYRRLVANVAAGTGSRFAAILIALGLATVLVRTLGVASYGTWSFFFVLLGYHAQFDFGLSVAIERGVARAAADGRPARVATLLNTGIGLALALSLVLQGLLLLLPRASLAALGDPESVRRCLLVLPLCLACSNTAAVAGAGLSGLQRTTTLALQRALVGGAAAFVVAALALGGVRRLDVLLVAYAAGLLTTAVASWRAVARETGPLPFMPWRADRGALGELTRLGGTLQVTTLVAQLGDQGLRLLLGSRFGAAAMGIYDLASRAAMAPRSIMAALLVALVPFAAGRERQGGRAALSDSLERSTRYATLMILAGTVSGLAVAGPLMTVWLGQPEAAVRLAQRLFEVLLVSVAIQSMASPIVALARGAGRPGPEAIVTTLSQPLALALAWQMPTPTGVIAVVALVLILAAAGLWLWLRHALGVAGLARADVLRLLAVATAGGMVGWAAHAASDALAIGPVITLVVVPPAILVTMAGVALALGCVSVEERRLLAGLIGRRGEARG
jgi:O-antigen/teichoic acid export membrane protein